MDMAAKMDKLPLYVYVDSDFVFVLYDSETQNIMFIGRVYEPTNKI